ncbi:MAG TPA: hypothetical protein VGA24_07170 [Steroidobacteraceae bacterium]
MAEIPAAIRKLAEHLADVHAAASDLQGKAAQMSALEKRIEKTCEDVDSQLKEIRKREADILTGLEALRAELAAIGPLSDEVRRNAEILTTIAKS